MLAILRRTPLLASLSRSMRFKDNGTTIEQQLQERTSGDAIGPIYGGGIHNIKGERCTNALQAQEIETRMMKVIHRLGLRLDLAKLDWDQDFRTMGLDSLQHTMLLTSVEAEFTTVFSDNEFSNMRTLNSLARHLVKEETLY